METIQIPNNMRDNVLMYFGKAGQDWLDGLPTMLKKVTQDWSLQIGKPYQNLSINYVAPATLDDGRSVVLKIGVPNKEIDIEISALSHFDGQGAVRLVGSDRERGILILERISPGTPLHEDPNCLDAVKIASEVMKSLCRPPPKQHTFPTVADWFTGLAGVRGRFGGGTGPFPERLFAMAENLSKEMIDSTKVQLLLHGDCHHDNIVHSSERGWLIIDPKGVVGDPVYELCTFLRNPVDLHERFDLVKALPRRVQLFAELLNFETERIASWGLAESILSARWDLDGNSRCLQKGIMIAEIYSTML